ncbi:MAG: hypothetical protein D3923_14560, partial [Candidatus Electrothrix sp. AR3]|nr:hypothetical protein [Candidatus Electrothrix sp. AR3]
RTSEEAAEKAGLRTCDELVLKTPQRLIVMCCSGAESALHFHLITVLEKDGNQALTKMQLARIVPLLDEELEG